MDLIVYSLALGGALMWGAIYILPNHKEKA